jgi:aldose 1-epimerase
MKPYGKIEEQEIFEHTIGNGSGLEVSIINYGATITSIITPDRDGIPGDVILGFDSLEGYLQAKNPFMNAIIGRYANRIANAKFSLNGVAYKLEANERSSCLHGGTKAFDKQIWSFENANKSSVTLKLTSPDGDGGFPGELSVEVIYSVDKDNILHIDYKATTTKATPVSLTSHCYFNLSGGYDDTILGHTLQVNSQSITAVDELSVPTGEFTSVEGTGFNLRIAKLLKLCSEGFDHNWVLDGQAPQATLYHIASGRCMEMYTTEPGVQVYTSKFLDGSLKYTKKGRIYNKAAAICLEAQHYADSPNKENFPTTILNPGEVYTQKTSYKFYLK